MNQPIRFHERCSNLPRAALLCGAVLAAAGFSADASGKEGTVTGQATIVNARAEGLDLHVTLDWPHTAGAKALSKAAAAPTPSTRLVVRSTGDKTVAAHSVSAPPEGGLATEVVRAALTQVETEGIRYTISLESSGGTSLSVAYPILVRLRCSRLDNCEFYLAQNLTTDAVFSTEALNDALDEAEVSGSQDLLGDVVAARPDLRGDAYLFGLQMAAAPGGSGSPCRCFWSSIASESVLGLGCCGATHLIEATVGSDDFPFSFLTGGETRMGLELRCWETDDTRSVPVEVSGTLLNVLLPYAAPCETPCGGVVRHDVVYNAAINAEATSGTASVPTHARVDTHLLYSVDSTLYKAESQVAEAFSYDTTSGWQADDDAIAYSTSIWENLPSTASLFSYSFLTTDGPMKDGLTWTAAHGWYTMGAEGNAICASPTSGHITKQRKAHLDDKRGTNLSILVGDCP